MRACQVHHLVRRLRRLFSVRTRDESFSTFAVHLCRELLDEETRAAPPRSPAQKDEHHRHLVQARWRSNAILSAQRL